MDLSGIDCAVWFPTLGLFTPDIQNWDFQYAVMRALNDWTAKVWATGKRHLWCVTIPLNPKWAVEEIKRCRKLGRHRGVDAPERDAGRALVERGLGSCGRR